MFLREIEGIELVTVEIEQKRCSRINQLGIDDGSLESLSARVRKGCFA